MKNCDKIITACRIYQLKARALPIIISAVCIMLFLSLGLNADAIFGEELTLTVPLIVLAAIALVVLLRELWITLCSRPGRLRIHLGNLSSEERARICEEFATAEANHGRYFLSDFMLFFPFEPGFIRYSMIESVAVYPTSVSITGKGRLIFIRTEKSENPDSLAEKLLERMPYRPETEDASEDEAVIEAELTTDAADNADNADSTDSEPSAENDTSGGDSE